MNYELSVVLFLAITLVSLGIHKNPLLPSFQIGVISFISISVYFFTNLGDISNDSTMATTVLNVNNSTTVYAVYNLYFLALLITLPLKKERFKSQVSIADAILKLVQHKSLKILGAIYLLLCLFHFAALDLDLFFSSYSYLSLSDFEINGINNNLLQFVHRSLKFMGLVSSVLLTLQILQRKVDFGTMVFFGIFAYATLIVLSLHSRFAVLFLITPVPFLLYYRKYGAIIVLIVLGITTFLTVFSGRLNNQFGLNAVVGNFYTIGENIKFLSDLFLYNFFGGAVNFSFALNMADPLFENAYKIRSFSPLPSLIDGYAGLFEDNRIYYAPHAPINSFGQLYWFGGFYFLLHWLLITATVRVSNLNVLKFRLVGYLVATPLIFSVIVLQQYPLRNSIRSMFIALILGVLLQKKYD